MADLKDLRRTSTVEDYQRQFLSILCHCEDMTQLQQTQMFTAGLGEPLRTDVEPLTPTTLQRAMHLARAYERRMDLSMTPSRAICYIKTNDICNRNKALVIGYQQTPFAQALLGGGCRQMGHR